MMMSKCNTAQMAGDIARQRGVFFGMSVLDGKWYVGTESQLKAIGVVKVEPALSVES